MEGVWGAVWCGERDGGGGFRGAPEAGERTAEARGPTPRPRPPRRPANRLVEEDEMWAIHRQQKGLAREPPRRRTPSPERQAGGVAQRQGSGPGPDEPRDAVERDWAAVEQRAPLVDDGRRPTSHARRVVR